jgi:hypothetical protein
MKRPDTASSAAPSGKRGRLAIIFMLCALTAPTAAFSQTPAGTVVNESAHFKSLEGNLLKDSADRSFAVYLPFSYQNGRKRYPVIYLLHGGNHSYPAWIDDPHYATVPKIMDKLIASGSVREMIIVMPDGSNAFGNSMWTNSGYDRKLGGLHLIRSGRLHRQKIPDGRATGEPGHCRPFVGGLRCDQARHEASASIRRRLCAQRVLPGMG